MKTCTLLGLLLSLWGSMAFYLASPNQRWLAKAWPRRTAQLAGAALLILGGYCLLLTMQAVTASFVFVTWLMLVFTALPYLGAWVGQGEGR